MALKDLASNLENFKYGLTSPDKVNSQIKDGVDFFDDNSGGATGFTPSVDLESRYKKFTEGTIGNKYPAAARSNEKTRTAYGKQGEYAEVGNIGLSNPSHILDGDVFTSPWSSIFPQFQSPFMDTPIAGHVSEFSSFSKTLGDKDNPIRGDKTFNDRTYYITNQPAANSFSSPSTPNAYGSPFMSTPIASNVSKFNPSENESLTYSVLQNTSTGPTQFTISAFSNTPSIPNAHKIAGDDGQWGGYNLPGSVSSAGQSAHVLSHFKRRGVYNDLINTSFEHQPFPISQNPQSVFSPTYNRYFNENSGKSIHISPGGELRVGFRYGAIQNGQFNNLSQGIQDAIASDGEIEAETSITDVITSPTITPFATLTPITGRTSQFSSNETPGADTVYTTPNNFEGGQLSLNLPNFNIDAGGISTNTFSGDFSVSTLKSRYNDDDFSDDYFAYGITNTFKNVPAGIDKNGKVSTKSYRAVSDPNAGLLQFRQPFILRDVGNKWGADSGIVGHGAVSELVAGFVRGAPGITGLMSRSINDKFRIGKFLLTTNGIAFLAKQFILQGLNPTIESKLYNPLSVLGIVGGGQLFDTIKGAVDARGANVADLARGLGPALATALLPIGHPERHLGGLKYEDINPLKELKDDSEPGKSISRIPVIGGIILKEVNKFAGAMGGLSRLAMQSNPAIIPQTTISLGFLGSVSFGGADLKTSLVLMNPNKYMFPISSAPKSITRGVPSFTGGVELAAVDADKVQNTPGGTFNKATNDVDGFTKHGVLIRHSTLAYSNLKKDNAYGTNVLVSAGENNEIRRAVAGANFVDIQADAVEVRLDKRIEGKKINDSIGSNSEFFIKSQLPDLGLIKGNIDSSNVDKINMIPAIKGETNKDGTAKLPDIIKNNPDFIKFMFKDVTNNKYLVFRAILDGISDSVTPNFSDTQYIGRPDKLYTYTGTDRSISFNFKVYPKSKQELPVLMEKLNYLVGMCYPSFTEGQRMITPFMELTLGDMFNGTPGLLETLSLTVEDATTWEIDEGLQYPHFISAACTFKHIGKYVPTANGKHYDLPWLNIGNRQTEELPGFEPTPADSEKVRVRTKFNYIDTIGATAAESL